jgi:hypothetical protein
VIGEDVEKLLKKCEPDIRKAIMTFFWLHQIGFEENEFPLVYQGDDEINGRHKEVMMTLADADYQIDPNLLPLGIWEIGQDYPRKLSG